MLCYVTACLVLCAVPVLSRIQVVNYFSSDDDAPTPELAHNHGYVCETHEVVTEDGYVLGVHRLPGGRVSKLNTSLTPVLIQHGLLDSSADWLLAGPDKALGYILADQGYDVWLGNARGNVYSRKHKTLNPNDNKFWDWTWHEMGHYDLPAVIDHILNVTGHSQVFYVGHSMGTTMFFVLCSTRPEYNAKVRYMAAMAPVAFMTHTTSPIRYLASFAHSFEIIYDYFGHGQFLPRNKLIDDIIKGACEAFEFEKKICENWLFVICGHDPNQFDEKLLPLILGHNPAGTSTKTLVHYAQEIKSGRFQQYDYGVEGNRLRYNSTTPPQYNLSQVTTPVSLHYGDNDLLANPLDIQELYKGLASPKGMFLVGLKGWNHLDFLWGRDAPTLVYAQIEELFRRYAAERRKYHSENQDYNVQSFFVPRKNTDEKREQDSGQISDIIHFKLKQYSGTQNFPRQHSYVSRQSLDKYDFHKSGTRGILIGQHDEKTLRSLLSMVEALAVQNE